LQYAGKNRIVGEMTGEHRFVEGDVFNAHHVRVAQLNNFIDQQKRIAMRQQFGDIIFLIFQIYCSCYSEKLASHLQILSLNQEEVLILLFHEMVHIYNKQLRKDDVGTNSYHKKIFANKVLECGFFSIRHKNQGWCLISTFYPRNVVDDKCALAPSSGSIERRQKFFSDLYSSFDWGTFFESCHVPSNNPKKYTFKYECKCPSPYNSIRSGRGLNSNNPLKVKCLACDSMFVFRG